jgi:hypothetical protein
VLKLGYFSDLTCPSLDIALQAVKENLFSRSRQKVFEISVFANFTSSAFFSSATFDLRFNF